MHQTGNLNSQPSQTSTQPLMPLGVLEQETHSMDNYQNNKMPKRAQNTSAVELRDYNVMAESGQNQQLEG
jgi:hypothetical protein